jgi:hypothetical protein
MQHQVNGYVIGGEANGPKQLLRVFDVDVAGQGDPQKTDGFLPVNQSNDPASPFLLDFLQNSHPACSDLLLFHAGNEKGRYKDYQP